MDWLHCRLSGISVTASSTLVCSHASLYASDVISCAFTVLHKIPEHYCFMFHCSDKSSSRTPARAQLLYGIDLHDRAPLEIPSPLLSHRASANS